MPFDTSHRLSSSGIGGFLDRADHLLQSPATKLCLSFLIILSVLPAATLSTLVPAGAVRAMDSVFLCLFAPEFLLRSAVYVRSLRRKRASRWEPVLLGADLLALLSFLPLHGLVRQTAYFRIFRLTRMLLLLGYWGEMVVDLWRILTGKERRAPVIFVLLLGLVLSFAGAIVLAEFAPPYDYDEDGTVDARDHAFHRVLWWSFRQVQDPGNLAAQPAHALLVVVSLVLTFAGLLLFTFLIGISTGAMDELLRRARSRPVGLRGHTVILGLGPYAFYLLEELAEIYRKNAKVARVAILGPDEDAPAYLLQKRLASVRYRSGDPVRVGDLDRVDVAEAKRILVLGPAAESPDAAVISTILAARSRNRHADIYPDLDHERNFSAARTAGGPRTHTIGSGSFLGYYVAQNVIYPGIYRAYRQLLTTAGSEIYTYVFDDGERRALAARGTLDPTALFAAAHLRHRVTLLGFFVDPGRPESPEPFDILLNPMCPEVRRQHPGAFDEAGGLKASAVRALVGVCIRWHDLRQAARSFLEARSVGEPMEDSPGFDGLELRLPAGRVERVLICGSSPRVPRVITELAIFFGHVDVTVLVREEANVGPLEESIQAAFEGHLSGLPSGSASAWTVDEQEGCPVLRVPGEAGETKVRVIQADWSDATRILRHPAADLSAADAVLFLPREGGDESDGLVALDCLRIAQFGAAGVVRFRPGLRVVGMMRDPVKSDLLESRLDEMSGAGADARFTVVSSERVRHHFMVQHVFVRGLGSVLLEMLGASGQHLCRLVPAWGAAGPPEADFDPWDLVRHLYVGRGLVPVGLERTRDPGGLDPRSRSEVGLDPAEMSPGNRIPWSSVAAIYAIGDGRALLGSLSGPGPPPPAATSRAGGA